MDLLNENKCQLRPPKASRNSAIIGKALRCLIDWMHKWAQKLVFLTRFCKLVAEFDGSYLFVNQSFYFILFFSVFAVNRGAADCQETTSSDSKCG